MKNVQFVLKSVGLATLISTISGIFFGFLSTLKNPDHAHQIFPSWMIFGVFFFFAGILLSSLISIVLVILKQNKIMTTSYIVLLLTILISVFYIFY